MSVCCLRSNACCTCVADLRVFVLLLAIVHARSPRSLLCIPGVPCAIHVCRTPYMSAARHICLTYAIYVCRTSYMCAVRHIFVPCGLFAIPFTCVFRIFRVVIHKRVIPVFYIMYNVMMIKQFLVKE